MPFSIAVHVGSTSESRHLRLQQHCRANRHTAEEHVYTVM